MSFKKIQKISPQTINNPEQGYIYLGQDDFGLWEKDEVGNVWYIQSGITNIIFVTGSTSSGTSGLGASGSSGLSGTFGTSGSSGKTGVNGTSGTSGINGSGTSGSSGISGSLGTSGTSGFGTSGISGSSGVDGIDGSSGTSSTSGTSGWNGSSGTSAIDGGYGGSTRRWILDLVNKTPSDGNVYISGITNRLDLLEYIRINKIGADNDILSGWMDSWSGGTLTIEVRRDLSIFGIYSIESVSRLGNFYQIDNFIILSASDVSLSDGMELLISFIPGVSNITGTYNFDGSDIGTVYSMNIVNGIVTSITIR